MTPAPHLDAASHRSDTQLVDAARAGDQAAFAELVVRYQSAVCSFACALTGSVTESEELAQEAFVLAWRRLADLRRADRFRSWVLTITRNVASHSRRTRRGQILTSARSLSRASDLPSAEPSPLDRLISLEEERQLQYALGAIPEMYRIPLVFFYRERKSIEEVAGALDLTPNNVRQRLWRARQLLHQEAAALIESALVRTRPAGRFTTAVLTALSVSSVGGGTKPRSSLVAGVAALAMTLAFLGGARFSNPGSADALARPPAANAQALPPAAPRRTIAGRAEGLRARELGARPNAARPATAAPEARVLVSFDFEDGLMPFILRGERTTGPCPIAGQSCVIGGINVSFTSAYSVSLLEPRSVAGRMNTLVEHTPTAELGFDYWLGDDATDLLVEMNLEKHGNYDLRLSDIVRESWTHVVARLADFVPVSSRNRSIEPGDHIRAIDFMGGHLGGKPLYIDNVRIVDYP